MSEQKCAKNKATLLQTCTVTISIGDKNILARLLCDSGSEKTFVKRTLIKKLKLKSLRKENLLVYLLGKRQPYEATFDILRLHLTSVAQ